MRKREIKTVEEMGELISPNIYSQTIHLSQLFIRENLHRKRLKVTPSNKEKITNIACPFCQKGFLKIIAVTSQSPVAPGLGSWVTYRYQCACSNKECKGRFVGHLLE